MEYVKFTIKEACEVIGVELPEEHKAMANDVLTNVAFVVNSLAAGGGYILSGKNKEDREEQLKKALAKNPKFVFAGKASRKFEQMKTIPHVIVPDPYDAMVKLSNHIRNRLQLKVVGVTGSLGKTTTKEMIYTVLKQEYVTGKNYGNRNNTKGIFNSLQEVGTDVQCYVQEFGVAIGKKSMESKIQSCVPNAAVITNINDPHLDHFGTRENILKEKIKLVTEMAEGSPAFLNYDDKMLKEVKLEKHPIVSFAIDNQEADYHAENIQYIEDYITFDAVHGERRTPITLHSREKHNVGNALVAMAVAEYFGVPLDKIVKGIDEFRSEGIRQSLVNVGGYKLYVDCYNTAPVSLLGSIDVLSRLPVEEGGKRVAVLGDIVRLGTEEEKLHIEVGQKIGRTNIDLVLCFGNYNAKLLAETIRKEDTAALYTDDRNVLNDWMRNLITRKDVTLVKGPVARLLSKSIDQVYGTAYHENSEHHELTREGDYRVNILFEKEDHTKTTVALREYKGKDEVHVVPATIRGIDVFSVFEKCFKNNTTLKEVTIPAPIFNISESAFQGCENLVKVTLPSTLMVVGASAFRKCEALKEVELPEGTIDIGEKAFAGCKALEKLTIPSTVGHIGEEAFKNCGNLKIYCAEGSYAHGYVEENKLAYELV